MLTRGDHGGLGLIKPFEHLVSVGIRVGVRVRVRVRDSLGLNLASRIGLAQASGSA